MCFLFGNLAQLDSKRVSYPFAIDGIGLQAVSYMPDFDFLWRVSQGYRGNGNPAALATQQIGETGWRERLLHLHGDRR